MARPLPVRRGARMGRARRLGKPRGFSHAAASNMPGASRTRSPRLVMSPMLADERRLNAPQSVTRVIRILEALCASQRPVSLADLSRILETPKSSLAALLRGLAEEDFVVSVEGAWRLG